MRSKTTLLTITLFVFVILFIQNGVSNSIKKQANLCGRLVADGKICKKGEELTCSNGSKIFNARFIPNNSNIYYALITLKCPEFGGYKEESNAGDRDSCGHYQQRVSEYMIKDSSTTTKAGIARAFLGDSYNTIFNQENINFINQKNKEAKGNNNAIEYGQKMRDICSQINKAGGSEFFDVIQVARFKDSNLNSVSTQSYFDYLKEFKLREDTVDSFVKNLANSHRPSEQFRNEWEDKASKSLTTFLKDNEYSRVKANCSKSNTNCSSDFILPVKNAIYFCNYGLSAICIPHAGISFPYSDSYGRMIPHTGIDLSAKQGEPVYAVAEGRITTFPCPIDLKDIKQCNAGNGNYVLINHNEDLNIDFTTYYGHLYSIEKFTNGQKIKKGDKIGEIGTTGNSTGNHLHFQVNKNSTKKSIDPCSEEFGLKCPKLGSIIKEN